jgi:hypothetical protein
MGSNRTDDRVAQAGEVKKEELGRGKAKRSIWVTGQRASFTCV